MNIKNIFLLFALTTFAFSQGSLLLVGGGRDDYNSWSDLPYSWFVQQADSGKIINIDVSSVSDFYPGYFDSFGANGSEALQISSKTVANDSATYKKLISAKGIFMEGGNQYDYVSTWKGTLVEDAIHYIFTNGGAIGGTSAGLAVLGEVVYDAKFNSLKPKDAAYNAFHPDIHFEDDFLNILPGVLTDSHFHSRGRLGRLVPMLARRILENGEDNISGIGVADKTALCIDPEGVATAYGHGSVTILYQTENSKIVLSPGQPALFTDIGFDQLVHGAQYNIHTRELLAHGAYMSPYTANSYSDVFNDTTFNGADASSAALGNTEIRRLTSNNLNAWNGVLTMQAGSNKIPGSIIIPQLWNDSDLYENRIMGGIWGAVKEPGLNIIYCDDDNTISITDSGVITSDKILYVLETAAATSAGVNNFEKTNYSGIIGARLHFLTAGNGFDLKKNGVTDLAQINSNKPGQLLLQANYPNPFNPRTLLTYQLPGPANIELSVYNVQGSLIRIVGKGYKAAGTYNNVFDASGLSSGIYIVTLKTDYGFVTRKITLLK